MPDVAPVIQIVSSAKLRATVLVSERDTNRVYVSRPVDYGGCT